MSANQELDLLYKGESAKTVQDTIKENLTNAHNAYDSAVDDWDAIRAKFTVSGAIDAEFENVTLTGKNEVAKIFTEIDTLTAGINNIDMSWHDVSDSILRALQAYNNDSEGGN